RFFPQDVRTQRGPVRLDNLSRVHPDNAAVVVSPAFEISRKQPRGPNLSEAGNEVSNGGRPRPHQLHSMQDAGNVVTLALDLDHVFGRFRLGAKSDCNLPMPLPYRVDVR